MLKNFIEYFKRVKAVARVKYEIEEEVLISFIDEIEQCYEQNYTPRRTVEVIAEYIFK